VSISTLCFIVSIIAMFMFYISVPMGKSRKVSIAWLAVGILGLIIGTGTNTKTGTAPASTASEPTPAATSTASEAEPAATSAAPAPAAKKSKAARIKEVKKELVTLLRELEAMRTTKQFRELRFSAKNPIAADWKKRMEEVRERIEADDNLPVEVKIVPGVLLSLGLDYVWQDRGSDKKSDIEYDTELIEAGLNWKPGN